jgi:hypothetical protein
VILKINNSGIITNVCSGQYLTTKNITANTQFGISGLVVGVYLVRIDSGMDTKIFTIQKK